MKLNLILKPKIVIISLLMASQQSIWSQTKEDFEKTFQKETSRSESSSGYGRFQNVTRLSFYPDTLPRWFFNPPQSTDEYVYAIGISDPDLTPDEAAYQAMHRAKSLAILYNRAQIQYFRDVYTVEYSQNRYKSLGQRFDTYFKISGMGFADSTCFTLVNNYITRYNEAIVLIKFTPFDSEKAGHTSDIVSTVATTLYIEAQISGVFETQAEYELLSTFRSPSGSTISSNFVYTEKGNRSLSVSEFQGKKHNFPLFNYKYCDPTWAQNTQPLISYEGLWSIFSKKLLRQLTLETEQSSVNISNLGERYNPELRNLTREVAIKTAKMHINGIEFGADSIGFNIYLRDLK